MLWKYFAMAKSQPFQIFKQWTTKANSRFLYNYDRNSEFYWPMLRDLRESEDNADAQEFLGECLCNWDRLHECPEMEFFFKNKMEGNPGNIRSQAYSACILMKVPCIAEPKP